MRLRDLATRHHGRLETQPEAAQRMQGMRDHLRDIAHETVIGKSAEGRPILGYRIGSGPVKVSLVSGSHADEPVGSETIRLLLSQAIEDPIMMAGYLARCTFVMIPQINPDGEERNRRWMRDWPSLESYVANAVRELPGDDIEFGYPSMRPENEAAVAFWSDNGPIDLHLSLHGMGFAEGVMLLIERHWTSRTQNIRDAYTRLAASMGLGLHNHNRKGEKGFFYIEDGYTTTPEGKAMQAHFRGLGDERTASLFHMSSMEHMRTQVEDPLSLVTEIPLFAIPHSGSGTMVPENYVRLKSMLPHWRDAIDGGDTISQAASNLGIKPVPIRNAIKLQLEAIELGIETIEHYARISDESQ